MMKHDCERQNEGKGENSMRALLKLTKKTKFKYTVLHTKETALPLQNQTNFDSASDNKNRGWRLTEALTNTWVSLIPTIRQEAL